MKYRELGQRNVFGSDAVFRTYPQKVVKSSMFSEHEIQFRVRYQETDAQGRVHHANYFTYFEMGRVEQLRAAGYDYRRLEEEGKVNIDAGGGEDALV